MYHKINIKILYLLFIVLGITVNSQSLYGYEINVNSTDIPENYIYRYDKESATNKANIKSHSVRNCNWAYYCKNNTCIAIDTSYNKPFIEFPDGKGHIKNYIIDTTAYDVIERRYNSSSIPARPSNTTTNPPRDSYRISSQCKSDSDCFYHKCVYNECVFTDDPSIVHCDNICHYFAEFEFTYIHCGKAGYDTCVDNNECSSKQCDDGYCTELRNTYSETDHFSKLVEGFLLMAVFAGIVIISMIVCCIYCCCRKKHKKEKFEKLAK